MNQMKLVTEHYNLLKKGCCNGAFTGNQNILIPIHCIITLKVCLNNYISKMHNAEQTNNNSTFVCC